MKKQTIAGLLVVAGVLVVAGWFWLEHSTRPLETPVVSPAVTPLPANSGTGQILVPVAGVAGEVGGRMEEPAVPAAGVMITAADVLAEPGDDYVAIAKKLSTIVTDAKQPMEERAEALAHALNLSAGNEAEVLMPLVKDPQLPDELANTILDEALNRPLGFQADMYLAALPVRKSAEMQTKIREHLAFLTNGEDLGGDPKVWETAVTAARKEWAE
jgi:hypothetical protein